MSGKEISDWLKSHDLISRRKLEQKCSMPKSTLSKAINAGRGIPEKYFPALEKELKNYGLTWEVKIKHP